MTKDSTYFSLLLNNHQPHDLESSFIYSHHIKWSLAELYGYLEQTVALSKLAGYRVATIIEDPLLSGFTSLALMLHGATCIPLNPRFKPAEIQQIYDELDVDIVITDLEITSNLNTQAIQTIQASFQDNAPSPCYNYHFSLENLVKTNSDIALILLTSGSTGTPKAVPLTFKQLTESAQAVAQSLELSSQDTAINFLPMMHIGGLLDLWIAPLMSGGSIIFAQPDNPQAILTLMAEHQVSWIQGAPAMLNNLLRADNYSDLSLRLIRSVSAPLSAALYNSLNEAFKTPIIEIYGMSETAGMITSNPIGNNQQKKKSVGIVQNMKLEIRPNSNSNDPQLGEIWVSGEQLFSGYLKKEDNLGAWDKNWFFTGDLGYLDEDGYLFITGRQKEIINRGGQKVSPVEIDQLCESWPEIHEAASFGFTHPSLGEEVGLALVLKPKCLLDKKTITHRISAHLVNYKLPRKIIYLNTLPRNVTGKIQRHLLEGLANGSELPLSQSENLTKYEKIIHKLWQKNLSIQKISKDDDYFQLGGDSLSMVTLITATEKKFGLASSQINFYDYTSIRELAKAIEQAQQGNLAAKLSQTKKPSILPENLSQKIKQSMQSWTGKPVFENSFCIANNYNPLSTQPKLFWCCNGKGEYEAILDAIKTDFILIGLRTLYKIQKRRHRKLDVLAKVYADELELIQPEGAFILGGFCSGAEVIEKVAQQLLARGREITFLLYHDYYPRADIPAYHALVFSRDWERNPFNFYPNLKLGLDRQLSKGFGLAEWQGSHTNFHNKIFSQFFKTFIDEQLNKPHRLNIQNNTPIRPQVEIQPLNPLSIFLKTNQSITIEVLITNKSTQNLNPANGLSLHAFWLSNSGKFRYNQPMFVNLTQTLQQGESQIISLPITSTKPFRLEILNLSLIEEGVDHIFGFHRPYHSFKKFIITY